MELFSLFDFIFPLGDPVLAQMYGFNKVDTWILWVIAAAVYVVVCAFKGVGLYAMAKKRGNSALLCLLGFVPFASTYLMGRLAGELRLGNTKVKHIGLFAMLAELILCIGYAVQDIPQSVIFMNPDRPADRVHDTRIHEYGHTIQSLLLGPVWAFVIAIPSFIWCNIPRFVKMRKEEGVSYYKLYCEGWANLWGRAWSRDNFISEEFKTTAYYGKPIEPIDFSKKK